MAIGSPQTTEAHVDEAWTLLAHAAKDLLNPDDSPPVRPQPALTLRRTPHPAPRTPHPAPPHPRTPHQDPRNFP